MSHKGLTSPQFGYKFFRPDPLLCNALDKEPITKISDVDSTDELRVRITTDQI